jgi:NADPH-dependent curcumin reductase CurA
MPAMTNRQWVLARRPDTGIAADDLRWVESTVPEPTEGEFLVRNLCISCDPTQLKWLQADTYLPAVRVGDVVRSFAVGEVATSRDPRFHPGQLVQGLFGWQDYAVVRAGTDFLVTSVPEGVSIETAMSILGYTGLTAYFGLLDIGRPQAGETVVVSSAAGATGSAAGQIAKIRGCRVIGIAGGAAKCRYLVEELRFDDAIDYKSENVMTRLRETCPERIDVYFDNVGGQILDAALLHLALRGRVVLCGGMATYGNRQVTGPRNYLSLIVQRGRMEGFVVLDYLPRAEEGISALAGWAREGKLKYRIDLQYGLENAPAALARLFKGENMGKQLVRIDSSAPRVEPDEGQS